MTRERFIMKYLEQPENILVYFYNNHESTKPNDLVFEVLDDLESLYVEDMEKVKDIKKYREQILYNKKVRPGVVLWDFELN